MSTSENDSRQPNIVILILDAVRAKNVSCYGYSETTTPHLDAFATESVLFRHAFSTSTWTIPTHASFLSGLYLSEHRLESIKADRRFNEKIVVLPEALRPRKYRTVAFSQNTLFSPKYHLGEGFDEFYGLEDVFDSRLVTRYVRRMANGSMDLSRKIAGYVQKVIAPRLLLNNAYNWIDARDCGYPFFLMINITNAHYAWAPPPGILLTEAKINPAHLLKKDFTTLDPFAFNSGTRQVTKTHRRIWNSLYNAAIMHVDQEVGRFLHRLRHWRGWQNTVVVVTADHGEMLGGYRDIVGHTLSLHDNVIRVPLIVRHPEYPLGLEVEGVVQTLDLYSSVLEWANIPSASVPAAQVRRPSLSKAVHAADDTSGFAFAEEDYRDTYDVLDGLLSVNPDMDPKKYPRQQIAVRSATHKYIWCDDRPGEFYNLVTDPGEEHNLINSDTATEQAVLAELEHVLEAWRSKLQIFPPRPVDMEPETDSVALERLRALGYVA